MSTPVVTVCNKLPTADLLHKRRFWCRSFAQSVPYSAVRLTVNLTPFCKTLRFAVQSNQPIVPTTVPILLFTRRPLAVCRFVIALAVNTVKRMICRRRYPHISDEVLKRHPSVTDTNAHSAVSLVTNRIGVQAPLLHHRPNCIFPRLCQSMRPFAFTTPFDSKASATLSVSVSQVSTSHARLLSTVTEAIPVRAFRFVRGQPHHRQTAKALSRKVNDVGSSLSHTLIMAGNS